MTRWLYMCVVTAVLIGCSNSTPDKNSPIMPDSKPDSKKESPAVIRPPKNDPVQAFKEHVQKMEKTVATSATVIHDKQGWQKFRFKLANIVFDVKNTDSLISPLEGIIMCGRSSQVSPFFLTKEEAQAYSFTGATFNENDVTSPPLQLRYSWQDNRWVRTGVLEKNFNLDSFQSPTAPRYIGPFVEVKNVSSMLPAWQFFFNLLE